MERAKSGGGRCAGDERVRAGLRGGQRARCPLGGCSLEFGGNLSCAGGPLCVALRPGSRLPGSGWWSGRTLMETVSSLREGSRVQLRPGGLLPERLLQGRGLCQRHAAAPARQPGEDAAGRGDARPCPSPPRRLRRAGAGAPGRSRPVSCCDFGSLLHPRQRRPHCWQRSGLRAAPLRIMKTPSTRSSAA